MTQIKKITDKQGNDIYLRTHTKAVIDDNGYTAESRMQAMQDEINQAQLAVGAVPSDLTPTEGSSNWVTSDGIYNQLITGDTNTEIDLSQYEEVMAFPNPTKWTTNNSSYPYYGVFVPVTANKKYIIIGNSTNVTYYCFLTSNRYTNNSAVSYATGCTKETITPNTTVIETAPSNAVYMYVMVRNLEEDRKPQSVAIYNRISLREKTESIDGTVNALCDGEKIDKEPLLGSWQATATRSTITDNGNHNVSILMGYNTRVGFDISKVESGSVLHISYHYEKETTRGGAWGIGSTLSAAWVTISPISGSVSHLANLSGDMDFSFLVPEGTTYIFLSSTNYYENNTAQSFEISNFKAWIETTLSKELNKEEAKLRIPSYMTKYQYFGEKINIPTANNLAYENYMTLTTHMTGGAQTQGGINFGDYLFVGGSLGNQLDIYNLANKSFLQHITIEGKTANNRDHNNTLFFSNEYHTEGDEFPILYACSGYENTSGISYIYGYRITKIDNDFVATLVHTITLNFGYSWTEATIDHDHNYLWIKADKWYKYDMPLYANGDASINSTDNIIESFTLSPLEYGKSSAQGHLYYKDKIYFTSGTGSEPGGLHLVVINTKTKCRETDINLATIGLTTEPEFSIIYEGYLYIGYRNKLVKFYFD